jgi:hypothetical protein
MTGKEIVVGGKGGGSGWGGARGRRTRNFQHVLRASCPHPNKKLPASEVEILEGLSTVQKTLGHQRNAMHIVRELRARIEVKKGGHGGGRLRTSMRGVMRSSSLWWKRK